MMPHEIDALIIKGALIGQIPRLVDSLFAGRKVHRMGSEYRIGTNGSISVRLADGAYFNHETGEGGDVLTLIQSVQKTNFKDALKWAHDFAGHRHVPKPPASPQAPLQHKVDGRAACQREKALTLLKQAAPIQGTHAEIYLRAKRQITLESLPYSLGFVARAYNFTGRGFYPALIAAISDLSGEPIAAHCTFLNPATGDKLQGDGIKSRLIIGACRGGAIRLANATERLALCEGIEDGLSILQCAPAWPLWATGGTSGLRAVQIPSHVREVMICADGDDAGMQAAHDLSQRLINDGKKVRIARPPEGVKDFNDLLRRGGSSGK